MMKVGLAQLLVPKTSLALCLAVVSACGGDRYGDRPVLVDTAAQTGLKFEHANGMSGQYYFSEMVGSGSALVDIDNDGDLDLYLVQGRSLNPAMPTTEPAVSDQLFRNDLAPIDKPGGTQQFANITEQSLLHATGYGMGGHYRRCR